MTVCPGYGKETFNIIQVGIYLALQNLLQAEKIWHPKTFFTSVKSAFRGSKSKQRSVF